MSRKTNTGKTSTDFTNSNRVQFAKKLGRLAQEEHDKGGNEEL